MRSSPYRRGMRAHVRTSLGIVILLLMSSQYCVFSENRVTGEELSDFQLMESSARTTNLVDIPTWKLNDAWSYDGYLDVGAFVSSSGVSTNVQYLTGTLTQTVTGIGWCDANENEGVDIDVDFLCYRLESSGYYEAENINLDGNNGDLIVEMETEEWIRVSDLATVKAEATFDIDFLYQIWFWTYTVHVADLTVEDQYSPPLEGYDFPLSVGEEWATNYTQTTEFSGSSDYVDIPSDSTDSNSTSWEVVSLGYPGTFYNGCSQSYNITNYNSDGDEIGYKWYCPAIRGDIVTSYSVAGLGIQAEHELTTYQPAGRPLQISIETDFPLSPIDFEISAWINVSSQGQPVSGEDVFFRYEIGAYHREYHGGNTVAQYANLTTAANGSAFLSFDTGHFPDDSTSQDDVGSHGIIAYIGNTFSMGNSVIGATSLTIDDDIHAVDLVSRSEGVTVERTRGDRTVTLDSNIGFNAVPGDNLTFSIPILNRGILYSPETTMLVENPDGTTSSTIIPSLGSLQEMRVDVAWEVPSNQPSGDISLTFTADPYEQIADDGNRSNNEGTFGLFIGRLPTASLAITTESLTLTEVSFNGLSSYDTDGGEVTCEFTVEQLDGSNLSSTEEDCQHEYTWEDDGVFLVSLVVTDDENDKDHAQSYITILNRPPEVEIGSDQSSVPVMSPITFDIEESGDLDTQNPDAPIDIEWGIPCEEGQVGERCTVTPQEEGPFTIDVSVMDDDGAITQESLTVEVTNIAPSDPNAEIWFDGNRMIPQILGENARYEVNEGDVLIMRGFADDSPNDLSSLEHHWAPDAEHRPELIISSVGHQSEIEHIYETSGQHLATLQVVDDDGASTETLIIQFIVNNIAPTITPVANPLPVAEGGVMQFSVQVSDTSNDLAGLVSCFDLDPDVNSDSEGNSTDDCDIESQSLVHSWEDATTAPDSIVFHVTDDDGVSASVVIPVQINNLPPSPAASASDYEPTQGDVIVLSANGTTDSEFDMANMVYVWDLDAEVDSDGDGDPANDIDRQGRWIEVSFSKEGGKIVRMTAYDEGEGSSITLSIQVQKEPFGLSTLMADYGIYIGLVALIAILLVVLLQRMRKPQSEDFSAVEREVRRKGKNVSMDDAFDDPDYDPFDKDERNIESKKMSDKETGGADMRPPVDSSMESEAPPVSPELSGAFEELIGESPREVESGPPENLAVPVDEALDNEDIEALFDD